MSKPTETAKRVQCPSCGHKAKRVSILTLGALLVDEFAGKFTADSRSSCATPTEGCASINDDTGWRFCPSQDCDVVYFAEEEDTQFTKPQLQVPVGVKESSGERPLCFCFGHSVGSIKEELVAKGRSGALEDIRTKMGDPGCHCETSNPSGSCCLGSVTKGIQIAQEELGMNDSKVAPVSTATPSTGRGEMIAKIGTVASAIMASACCWLPLLLLALGVSGAGIAATLETYRPLFIVVTFGFLGAAFYSTYRPKKAAAETGHDCCPTESAVAKGCCTPTAKGRFNMMASNKVMLWVVTVLAVAFLIFPSYVGVLFGTNDAAAVTKDMSRAVFQIEGMTCEGCATAVAQAIRQVPGVVAVDVSYEQGQAVVGVNPGRPIPKEIILMALKKAGYIGELLSIVTGDARQVNKKISDCELFRPIGDGIDAISTRLLTEVAHAPRFRDIYVEAAHPSEETSITSANGLTSWRFARRFPRRTNRSNDLLSLTQRATCWARQWLARHRTNIGICLRSCQRHASYR